MKENLSLLLNDPIRIKIRIYVVLKSNVYVKIMRNIYFNEKDIIKN